jgi:hypothetical protein
VKIPKPVDFHTIERSKRRRLLKARNLAVAEKYPWETRIDEGNDEDEGLLDDELAGLDEFEEELNAKELEGRGGDKDAQEGGGSAPAKK